MFALLHLSLLWAWNKRQILVSLSFFSFIFIYKPEENRAIMIQQKKPNCSLSDWLKGLDSLQVKSIVVLKRHWHSISWLLFKLKRHENISFSAFNNFLLFSIILESELECESQTTFAFAGWNFTSWHLIYLSYHSLTLMRNALFDCFFMGWDFSSLPRIFVMLVLWVVH